MVACSYKYLICTNLVGKLPEWPLFYFYKNNTFYLKRYFCVMAEKKKDKTMAEVSKGSEDLLKAGRLIIRVKINLKKQ